MAVLLKVLPDAKLASRLAGDGVPRLGIPAEEKWRQIVLGQGFPEVIRPEGLPLGKIETKKVLLHALTVNQLIPEINLTSAPVIYKSQRLGFNEL